MGLDGRIAEYADHVRELLIDYLWNPWQHRLGLEKRLDRLERDRMEVVGANDRAAGFLGNAYWPA